MINLRGSIRAVGILKGALHRQGVLKGRVYLPRRVGTDVYEGAYSVSPDFEGTVLQTKEKFLEDDVTVQPIEVTRVSNTAGGNTVYIGGIFNG